MKNPLLIVLVIGTLACVSINAQTGATDPVLISVPKAVNPADGYYAGGTVRVRVSVNEVGDVTDVQFVSGPGPVCPTIQRADVVKTREAGMNVAREARFTPATNGTQPVASTALLSIEFTEKPLNEVSFSASNTEDKVYGERSTNTDADKNTATEPRMTIRPDAGTDPAVLPARKSNNEAPKTVSGGVLNGKAVSLPKPSYPAAARAVRASGAVQVQVLIDEDGNIFSAAALGGHPLLQSASVMAACGAKFTPTLLEGNPVKVSGIITYNFVP